MNYHCTKCGKSLGESQFYTYRDGSKTEMCKKCLTMHIDNWKPETFLWLLEKMDVPYVPEEWNILRDRAFAKNPIMTGMSVFGKYLSKMKLNQWKDKRWADSEALQAEYLKKNEEQKAADAEKDAYFKDQFEQGKISEAEYKTIVTPLAQQEEYKERAAAMAAQNPAITFGMNNPYNENNFIGLDDDSNSELVAELTDEDKKYLLMKWGKLYKPSEWIELEKTYNEMTSSFDIQDADTINSLILICKTNLKMNQCLDQGDIEGFQKLSKVSESLRKSAKFTAAQNKEEKNDYVDSIGELVSVCEREGFIPRYALDIPQDKVDITLKDMENYLYKLVTQDLGFGQQIENALKKIQLQKEREENKEEKDLFDDTTDEITDNNLIDFYQDIEKQKDEDAEVTD